MERAVRTPDGRTLAVEVAGDPVGRVVLVHGGTPNSRHLYGPSVADAAARGLRLIGYDRPGYGGSTPCPGGQVPADASHHGLLWVWCMSVSCQHAPARAAAAI
jgi:pimeloyl-ACP methyl ester carboxylesterase